MNAVEQEVLARIVPTPEVRASIKERADRLKAKVESYVAEHGIDAEAFFAGSYSKNTYLSDPDIDLFLLFPPDVSVEDMHRIGLKTGENVLEDGIRKYSEHPYTHGTFEGLDVDLVPCFHVDCTAHMKSSVDRTPFHTRFIKSHLDDDGCNQVRLLKKFMKGIGTYGAERDSRGFSGYLCEILVVRFGSFNGVLQAATRWRAGTVIEVDGRGPDFDAPLVVYDPVDNSRNAAAAVHVDTLALFVTAAREYLKEPRIEFFFPNRREPASRERIRAMAGSHGTRLVSAVFPKPKGLIDDNLQAQLWKTQYALRTILEEHEFPVIRAVHSMTDDTMTVVLELEMDVLPRTHKHPGPPAWVKPDSFLDKWKDNQYGEPFIEDGRWNVMAPRKYTEAGPMIRAEAVRSGAGKDLDISSMKVMRHEETLSEADPLLLTSLLDPRLPWEVRSGGLGLRGPPHHPHDRVPDHVVDRGLTGEYRTRHAQCEQRLALGVRVRVEPHHVAEERPGLHAGVVDLHAEQIREASHQLAGGPPVRGPEVYQDLQAASRLDVADVDAQELQQHYAVLDAGCQRLGELVHPDAGPRADRREVVGPEIVLAHEDGQKDLLLRPEVQVDRRAAAGDLGGYLLHAYVLVVLLLVEARAGHDYGRHPLRHEVVGLVLHSIGIAGHLVAFFGVLRSDIMSTADRYKPVFPGPYPTFIIGTAIGCPWACGLTWLYLRLWEPLIPVQIRAGPLMRSAAKVLLCRVPVDGHPRRRPCQVGRDTVFSKSDASQGSDRLRLINRMLVACVVALILIVSMLAVMYFISVNEDEETSSGETGDCAWTLEGTVLTVSGDGAMGDRTFGPGPWGTDVTEVRIEGGVTSVGDYAFSECRSLEKVSIADTVVSIGRHAFEGCSSLGSVSLPGSVVSVGDHAFGWCSSLSSVSIPASTTAIGLGAFTQCTSLRAIDLDPENPRYSSADGALMDRDGTELVQHLAGDDGAEYRIPDGVVSIADYAFYSCETLETVSMPGTLEVIGARAFEDCFVLRSVSIPDSVTYIGEAAFESCNSLSELTIGEGTEYIGDLTFSWCYSLPSVQVPASVSHIGDRAFAYCSALEYIGVSASNPSYSSVDGVLFSRDGADLVQYPAGAKDAAYDVPDGVVRIGDHAFAHCGLTTVTIPDSVTSVGSSAFEDCGSLSVVTMGNGVAAISDLAFRWCPSLSRISFGDSLSVLGTSPFLGTTFLAADGSTVLDATAGNLRGVLFAGSDQRLVAQPRSGLQSLPGHPRLSPGHDVLSSRRYL